MHCPLQAGIYMFSEMQNKYYLAYFVKNFNQRRHIAGSAPDKSGRKKGPVKSDGKLGYSDHETTEFKITDLERSQ